VFSPLTHNELLIDIIQDAVPGEHWMQFDLAILAVCKHLYVLKMEGWELSKGVAREIFFAKERGIAVQMVHPPVESQYLPWIRNPKENLLAKRAGRGVIE
jgi:hypothetical protein